MGGTGTQHRRVAAVLRGGEWKWWEGKGKRRGGRKTGPTELPCRRQQRQRGWEGEEGGRGKERGEKDPGETLNRCVKPLSAFLLGNARSGASRKTIWGLFGLPERQMCFNKTAALLANKVSLWLQPDEQTSRLLAGIQLQLGTASLPASCLALSLTRSVTLSLSHNLGEIEAGRLLLSLSVRVCMTHSVSYTRLLLDTSLFLRGERENYCRKNWSLWEHLCWDRAHTHTHK